MSRFSLIVICCLALFCSATFAATYTLTDGSQISGEVAWENANANGVVFRPTSGATASIIDWDKFSQDSLKQLVAQAPDKAKDFIQPLIEEPLDAKAKQREEQINDLNKRIKEPPKASLPKQNIGFRAIFSSPIGLFLFFVVYCATIFAAFEVAVFRNQPVGLVCGLAAVPFLGILSPIIFIALPTNLTPEEPAVHAAEGTHGEPVHAVTPAAPTPDVSNPLAPDPGVAHSNLHVSGEEAPAAAPEPPRAALPQPIVFKRGEFSFNRRFFETKLASFFRLVPSEADKDMVLFMKTARGDFTGRRIVNITPNEMTLQLFKGDVTANEVIPFNDVFEVQIRHKDFA